MLALIILLAVVATTVLAATILTVRRDGRGHTPPVRSTSSWMAGDLPSEPYASMASSGR